MKQTPSATPSETTAFNIRKDELVRLILQTLESLDYKETVSSLQKESGIQLHIPIVGEFCSFILDGKWESAIAALPALGIHETDKIQMIKYLIFRQKYLELLETRNTKDALHTLRKELAPCAKEPTQLHALTTLMMCQTAEELRENANWKGTGKPARQELLGNIQRFLPSSLMLPENKLQKLLLKAVEHQQQMSSILDAEASGESVSLLVEEIPVEQFVPKQAKATLEDHSDEIWDIQFSPDGNYFASCGVDKSILIYDATKLGDKLATKPTICQGHTDAVSCISFSPDSTLLLSGSNDKHVKLWDVKSGKLLKTFGRHKDTIASCAWLPNSKQFFTAGGKNDKTIRKWNASTGEQLDCWKVNYRVHDLAISQDGTKLVAIGHHKKIHVYSPSNKTELFSISDPEFLTSVTLSPCGRFALCSIAREEGSGKGGIRLWDLQDQVMVREYTGHTQRSCVLKAQFGGRNNCFVSSGSEDNKVYIWERKTGRLVSSLEGHMNNVTIVAWNPKNPFMFASASDDATVKIWTTNV